MLLKLNTWEKPFDYVSKTAYANMIAKILTVNLCSDVKEKKECPFISY